MDYLLDISNSYPRFLIFNDEQGLNCYISTPKLNFDFGDKLEVFFENIEVQILDEIWYLPILEKNPNSIIAKIINSVDLDDLSCSATIVLKNAKITLNNLNSLHLELECNGEKKYHTKDGSFDIGARKIWLTGRSSDYVDTNLIFKLIFSGEVNFSFNESDIVIKSIEFNEYFNENDILDINRGKDLMVKLRNMNMPKLDINNIKSQFFDFSFFTQYFFNDENVDVAIKSYSISK